MRIRASMYTILFIIAIVLGLVLSVFGNSISIFINARFPFLKDTTEYILEMRTLVTFIILFGFSLMIYRFLPNHKAKYSEQVPGAIFTAVAWEVISFIFSMYLTIFRGFSGLYGSMTAIILVMLWLYFSMYAILLGGLLNCLWQEKKEKNEKTA